MTKLLLGVLAVTALGAGEGGVAGDWRLVQTGVDDSNDGQIVVDCSLSQLGEQLGGSCGAARLEGTAEGTSLSWQIVVFFDQHTATMHYEGRTNAQAEVIQGTWRCPKHCENAAYKTGTFVMRRR